MFALWHGSCVNLASSSRKVFRLRHAVRIFAFASAGLFSAAPAYAAASIALPEPGALTLLGLGIAGLVIGRQAARKPPED